MPPEVYKLYVDGHTLEYGKIETIEEAKKLNENALHFEYFQNRAFIVAKDKAELLRLQEILKKNLAEYEANRISLLEEE
jgi:hypothetical protein